MNNCIYLWLLISVVVTPAKVTLLCTYVCLNILFVSSLSLSLSLSLRKWVSESIFSQEATTSLLPPSLFYGLCVCTLCRPSQQYSDYRQATTSFGSLYLSLSLSLSLFSSLLSLPPKASWGGY